MWHDEIGNSWTITVDVDAIRATRKLTGYDLANLFTEKGLSDLAADVVLLCDVVWSLVQDQAKAKNVSHAEFIRGMRGDAMERATDALLQAVIDFLPQSRAAMLARLRTKVEAVRAMAEAEALAAVERLEPAELLRPPANSGTR